MPRSQPANPAAAIRRELHFFTLYRVFEAALLCLTVFSPVGALLGEPRFPLAAKWIASGYLLVAVILFVSGRSGRIHNQVLAGILISESTRAQVKDILYREVDRVCVKGKDEPVGIFEPIGLVSDVAPTVHEEIRLWHQALRYYRQQDWDQAELQLFNLSRLNPDCPLYALYTRRITHYRAHPPGEGWDGVTRFDSK